MDRAKASCPFYSETTDSAGNGRSVDAIYLDFSKPSHLPFHTCIEMKSSQYTTCVDYKVSSEMTELPGSKSSGQWFEFPLVASYE